MKEQIKYLLAFTSVKVKAYIIKAKSAECFIMKTSKLFWMAVKLGSSTIDTLTENKTKNRKGQGS